MTKIKFPYTQTWRNLFAFISFLAITLTGFAEATNAGATAPAPEVTYPSWLAYILLAITVVLMLIIYVLGRVVVFSVKAKAPATLTKVVAILLIVLSCQPLFGTSVPAPVAQEAPSVVSAYIIYLLGSLILFELILVFTFAGMIFRFLKPEASAEKTAKKASWWRFLYRENTEAEVAQLDLGHNYDGIKELDNDIPAWWQWGFYGSMAFAVIYLFIYHVGKFAPLQQQELKTALAMADKAKAQIQKDQANSVDENTVVMLSGADLEAGKKLFMKPGACASCHGEDGSGTVNGNPGIGPNLTDKYWLHKGGIKDIFFSIKYGWPEKGMKPWKEDFSPVEIAQLASYVKSIQGTNPANPKEKQGELWEETTSPTTQTSDSAKTR